MEKAERTALARRIGRMTYEQVRPLFEEAMTQRQEKRGPACPDCRYESWRQYDYCEVYKALPKRPAVWVGRPGEKPPVDERALHLRNGCPNCTVRAEGQELYARCEKCEDASELFFMYSRRLDKIRHNEQVKRFKQAHGRLPATPLELAEWQDQVEERERDKKAREELGHLLEALHSNAE